MPDAESPDPKKSSGTYASKLSSNTNDLYDDRNLILVHVRKMHDRVNTNFDDNICQLALNILSINIANNTIGAQYLYDKVDTILRDMSSTAQDCPYFLQQSRKNSKL